MSVQTYNLNQAAFFVAIGAKLLRMDSETRQWHFTLRVTKWQIWYEKYIGYVPYRKFCGVRASLKEKVYIQEGRIPKFRGREDAFSFADVAYVRSFTKSEQARFN